MDTKKAIEFLEGEICEWGPTIDPTNGYVSDKGNLLAVEIYKAIIALLQQGEKCKSDFDILVGRWDKLFEENKTNKKYQQIVEELEYGFKNNIFFYNAIAENTPIRYAKDFLNDLKKKYFPKGDRKQ